MNAIVLVHGFTFSPGRVRFMADFLRKRGRKVLTPVLLPSNGSLPMETLAAMLGQYLETTTRPDERLDLIGFSMGGLVCRYYLQRLGGHARTDRFISIASPNHGTAIARFLPGAGMRQMRPGSAFLRDLNSDLSALEHLKCSVLYTPFDGIILPARSSVMACAANNRMAIPGHPIMLYHPAVFRKIAALLER